MFFTKLAPGISYFSSVHRKLDLFTKSALMNVPQIAATDKEINALVYKLYDLTEEEIKTVEGTEWGGKIKMDSINKKGVYIYEIYK